MWKDNLIVKFFQIIKSPSFGRGVFVILFLISIDQYIKFIIKNNFNFVCNQGIAFGIKLPTFIFTIIWILIMIYFLNLWIKEIEHSFFKQFSFLLIIAGGFGNIIDRILYQCVIDFLPFLNWFVFNLADIFITTGIILLFFKVRFKN